MIQAYIEAVNMHGLANQNLQIYKGFCAYKDLVPNSQIKIGVLWWKSHALVYVENGSTLMSKLRFAIYSILERLGLFQTHHTSIDKCIDWSQRILTKVNVACLLHFLQNKILEHIDNHFINPSQSFSLEDIQKAASFCKSYQAGRDLAYFA